MWYDEEGIEHCDTDGTALSAVRFTVKEEGTYKLEIKFENGTTKAEKIHAKGFASNGYVEVSAEDPRYFTCSDGEAFYPIGINLAFPRRIPVSNQQEFGTGNDVCYIGMRQYERWMKRCAENGVNMVRVWVGHEYFSPDTEDAAVFDYAQFSKIDLLLELARKYDVKLKLTLEQFRFFDYDS